MVLHNSVSLALVAAALLAAPVLAEDNSVSGSGELRVYVDPATGQLAEPPAAEQQRRAQPAAGNSVVNTSHDGLTVRQGTTDKGGVILDLGGRFQDELQVTHDACGNKLSCKQTGTTGEIP